VRAKILERRSYLARILQVAHLARQRTERVLSRGGFGVELQSRLILLLRGRGVARLFRLRARVDVRKHVLADLRPRDALLRGRIMRHQGQRIAELRDRLVLQALRQGGIARDHRRRVKPRYRLARRLEALDRNAEIRVGRRVVAFVECGAALRAGFDTGYKTRDVSGRDTTGSQILLQLSGLVARLFGRKLRVSQLSKILRCAVRRLRRGVGRHDDAAARGNRRNFVDGGLFDLVRQPDERGNRGRGQGQNDGPAPYAGARLEWRV
jgi:hypothetical protein